ncbi:co-chaperone GroES [Paenibacillus kobensis]|uniref:co-chaperone GroES n=1 Tax=Paenibacillus kobensis TaxID=59841 RepID=UPI000FD7262C|nr:co-chaperone GroES [Paenibacillus kobensis]
MIKPIGDRIVIEPILQEDITSGGIILPESAKEMLEEGKVLATGAGVFRDGQRVAPEVKAGDKVLYSKHVGTPVKVSGKEVLVMHESDILVIIS